MTNTTPKTIPTKSQAPTPAASAIPAAASESKHNADQPRTADTTGSPKPAAQPGVAPKKPVPVRLPLAEITVDESLQCRAKIDEKVVEENAGWMEDGVEFAPVVVFEIDGKRFLADGFHRFAAAKLAGLEWLWADIRQGERGNALAHAIRVNSTHGLRFSNADKRHAVELALREFPDTSDRVLAEICKVSPPFVAKLRKQVETDSTSETRMGKDGKKYPAPAKRAIAKADSAEQPAEDGTEQRASKADVKTDGPAPDGKGAQADEQAKPAEACRLLQFNPELVPLADLKKRADQIYNIFSNPARNSDVQKLIGFLQRELDRWAEWQSKQT